MSADLAAAIAALPPLRETIARHGLSARKGLGQNFLLDLNLTDRIARAGGPLDGATVLEVGPGPGGLTRRLLANGAAEVIAIEKDARCLPALAELSAAAGGRLTVHEADALAVDDALLGSDVRVVANLPYNVGTALLVRWLSLERWPPWWSSLTLLFQKEVAQRIVASPGSEAYGRLSVLAQWRCTARILFDIGPQAFTPPPKITSSLIRIEPREPLLAIRPALLGAVTAAAFGQRRKMLRSSLGALGVPVEALAEAAGIDLMLRAEAVPVIGFCRLAAALGQLKA